MTNCGAVLFLLTEIAIEVKIVLRSYALRSPRSTLVFKTFRQFSKRFLD